jgi:hypothetical protein
MRDDDGRVGKGHVARSGGDEHARTEPKFRQKNQPLNRQYRVQGEKGCQRSPTVCDLH